MEQETAQDRSRRIWGTGDYRPTARQLMQASTALVEALGITAGQHVLDVAAGDGNCAIAAAARGATVCATDFSPPMIEAGRRRSDAEGVAIDWYEAEADTLPFADGTFDRVTSVFGAIFAPQPEAVAAELLRVTRPGGMVGLTAWTDDGYTAGMLEIARGGRPMPPDAPDPLLWGRPDEVRAIFAALGCEPRIRRRAVTFRYPSWRDWREAIEAHGMAVVAKQSMDPEAFEEMSRRIQEHAASYDYGEGETVVYDADYLEVLVPKP